MTAYYDNRINAGEEYQDFICDQLRKANPPIIVQCYSSRRYQWERGESAQGIEIKFDDQSGHTPNLFIEYEEKTNKNNREYVPSGIMRKDNSWLYLIGNYIEAFLFSKEQLRRIYLERHLYERRGIRVAASGTATSHGILLPKEYAVRSGLCLNRFVFKE